MVQTISMLYFIIYIYIVGTKRTIYINRGCLIGNVGGQRHRTNVYSNKWWPFSLPLAANQKKKKKKPCPLLTCSFPCFARYLSASRSLRFNIYPPLIGLFSLVSFIFLFLSIFMSFTHLDASAAPKVSLPLDVVRHFISHVVSSRSCVRARLLRCVRVYVRD